jgi:hypothetical protein
MNRALWEKAMTDEWVPWLCPSCGEGQLKIEGKRIITYETKASEDARSEPDFSPDWVTYRFASVLRCDSMTCGENVAVLGTGSNEQIPDPEDGSWYVRLSPLYFEPPLQIVRIPEKFPENVRQELLSAFSLFWCHTGSASNRIRTAIELLLTHLKVRSFHFDKNAKRERLTLHARILLFRRVNEQLADHMMAIKWLGNEGSHPGSLSKEDLLDAFELVEDLLEQLLDNRKKRISRMTKVIIQAKGSRSSRANRGQ